MTDWDKKLKRHRKSIGFWYEWYKIEISEFIFCLKNRLMRDCSNCNYFHEDKEFREIFKCKFLKKRDNMKLIYCLERMRRVYSSCTCIEQVKFANYYCSRLVFKSEVKNGLFLYNIDLMNAAYKRLEYENNITRNMEL